MSGKLPTAPSSKPAPRWSISRRLPGHQGLIALVSKASGQTLYMRMTNTEYVHWLWPTPNQRRNDSHAIDHEANGQHGHEQHLSYVLHFQARACAEYRRLRVISVGGPVLHAVYFNIFGAMENVMITGQAVLGGKCIKIRICTSGNSRPLFRLRRGVPHQLRSCRQARRGSKRISCRSLQVDVRAVQRRGSLMQLLAEVAKRGSNADSDAKPFEFDASDTALIHAAPRKSARTRCTL